MLPNERTRFEALLLQWNPHWRESTIKSWHDRQLYAVYMKELRRRENTIRQQKKTG